MGPQGFSHLHNYISIYTCCVEICLMVFTHLCISCLMYRVVYFVYALCVCTVCNTLCYTTCNTACNTVCNTACNTAYNTACNTVNLKLKV